MPNPLSPGVRQGVSTVAMVVLLGLSLFALYLFQATGQVRWLVNMAWPAMLLVVLAWKRWKTQRSYYSGESWPSKLKP